MTDNSFHSLRLSLRRVPGKALLLLGLVAVTALAWIYLLAGAGLDLKSMAMDMGASRAMPMPAAWSFGHGVQIFVMWATMMVAMMLPSAAPSILEWVDAGGARPSGAAGVRAALSFGAGYLLIWAGFSLCATLLHWVLDSAGLLSADMALRGPAIAGAVVIAIGLYQLTPLKQVVLRSCRAAADCSAGDQRQGAWVAARQGIWHGLACLACCWALMGLLFVGGAMNLLWIALMTLWVFAENNLSWGGRLARLGGAGLLAWGVIALARAL